MSSQETATTPVTASTTTPGATMVPPEMTSEERQQLIQWLTDKQKASLPTVETPQFAFVPQASMQPAGGSNLYHYPQGSVLQPLTSPANVLQPVGPAPDASWLASVASMVRNTMESCGWKANTTPPVPQESTSSGSHGGHRDGPPAKRARSDGPEFQAENYDIEAYDSDKGEEIVDEEEDEEEQHSPTETEAQLYREKIKLVRTLEGLETKDTELKSAGSLSVEPVEKKTKLSLPPSMGFYSYFDEHNKSLKGTKVIKGVQKPPTKMGDYPKLFAPNPVFYAIEECPWQAQGLIVGGNLLHADEKLYTWGKAPQIRCDESLITKLESNERKSINVASYNDHFIFGSKLQLKAIQTKLTAVKENTALPYQGVLEIFKLNEQLFGLLDSIAKGNQNMAYSLVDRVSLLTTLRRDAWLKGMDQELPTEERYRLRALSVNTPQLFPEEEVSKAKKALKSGKEEKLHDQMLKNQFKNSNNRNTNASTHINLFL